MHPITNVAADLDLSANDLMVSAINPTRAGEGVPALVRGGPFGNTAHGCHSVMVTKTAAVRVDYVVTEAGFGFDLGAEGMLRLVRPGFART